jgi:Major Facilitator Superfamily
MQRRILGHRSFRLLLAGQTLTMFGDLALVLVLGIWAKELTGSTAIAGSVFLALLAPMLLAPLLGLIVDRFPRRKVLIANDLATAVALLPLLLIHDRGDVWILFVVGAAYGLSQQVFFAARAALLETMLDDDELGSANALLEILRQALRVCGPAVGAGLFAAFGGAAVALLDVGTFIASAALLAMLRAPDIARRAGGEHTLSRQLTAGLRHISGTPMLRRLIRSACAAVAVLGIMQVAGLALVDTGLHRPATFLGVILAFEGLGSIAGGLLSPSALRRFGEPRFAAIGLATMGLGVGLMAVPHVTPVLVGAAFAGAGFSAFMVGYTTLLQRSTATQLQGRVFTAAEAAVCLPYCGTLALAVVGVGLVDYRVLMLGGMVLLAVAGAYLARGPDAAPSRVGAAVALARRASAH